MISHFVIEHAISYLANIPLFIHDTDQLSLEESPYVTSRLPIPKINLKNLFLYFVDSLRSSNGSVRYISRNKGDRNKIF
jgi:hypothetical protein